MKLLMSGANARNTLAWEQKKQFFFEKADMQSIACQQKPNMQPVGASIACHKTYKEISTI